MSPDALPLPDVSQADTASASRPDDSGGMPDMSGLGSGPTPSREDTHVPKIDGYQIVSRLGQGGMGTVWKAIQLGTRRTVALKLMSAGMFASDRARMRFDREVELTARLDHPNIAQIFDSGLDRGVYYYAMEFVEGQPLDHHVSKNKLTYPDALALMKTVCEAVQHAHQRGVIHRDLKPGNILVSADGQPFVLDFGLAKTVLQDANSLHVSMDNELAGTPAYMSPEQAAGKIDQLDTRTDVYSLGVIIYRLLTGQSPHSLEGGQVEVLRRIIEEEPKRPRAASKYVDGELDAVLLKALARDQNDRYATAGDLAEDIGRYLNGEPLQARKPSAAYFLRKYLAKHLLSVSVTAAILAILVSGVVFSYVRIVRERDLNRFLLSFTNELNQTPQDRLPELPEKILTGVLDRLNADAGSIFLSEGSRLRFAFARNRTLEQSQGQQATEKMFSSFTLPIDKSSIAGYVASTRAALNIEDAYAISADRPYKFNPGFDNRTQYHTGPMLTVPILDANRDVLGILQLINRTENGKVIPFDDRSQELATAMASQAALFLRFQLKIPAATTQP